MRSKSQLLQESRHCVPSSRWWAWFFIEPDQYRFERVLLLRINTVIREYVDEFGVVNYPQPFFMNLQLIIGDWVRNNRGDFHAGIDFLQGMQADLFSSVIKQRINPHLAQSEKTAIDQLLLTLHYQSVVEAYYLARETQLSEAELSKIFDFPKRLRCLVTALAGSSLATLVAHMLDAERHERVVVPFPVQKAC